LEIKRKKIFNNEEITKLANFLIEELFINDMFNLLHKYMNDELNKSDNSTYLIDIQKIKQLSKQLDLNINQAINKVSNTLEKNVLFPNYVRQYVVLDSYYLNWINNAIEQPDIFIRDNLSEFTIKSKLEWNFSINDQSSENNNIIKLKYPIKNLISIQILPFYMPYHIIYNKDVGEWLDTFNVINCPYNNIVGINIDQISEKFYINGNNTTKDIDNNTYKINNTIYGYAKYVKKLFNLTNYTNITQIEPFNNGIIQFRYPIQQLTKLSISMYNMGINQIMRFATPTLYVGYSLVGWGYMAFYVYW
jgi:hypothetical protein